MLEQLNNSLQIIVLQTQANMHTLAVILLVPWLVFVLSRFDKHLLLLGILPRTLQGLPGIVFAPLLHANFNHLFFNSIPLLVLSNFLLFDGLYYYLYITLALTVGSGFLIWCFGKPGLHIGASALITGYWAILVSNIIHQGTITAIILGIVCVYYFAGIFLGVFPGKRGVSWEGHLFGLLTGFLINYCNCVPLM